MKPEYKIGDNVYISRFLLYDTKIYTIYEISDELGIYTIIEKGGIWNPKEGYFELPNGDRGSVKHVRFDDLISAETGLDFMIDRFSFLINRHVIKTKQHSEWKAEKDNIIKRISKKLYDNR
jgi:hypothetical protein